VCCPMKRRFLILPALLLLCLPGCWSPGRREPKGTVDLPAPAETLPAKEIPVAVREADEERAESLSRPGLRKVQAGAYGTFALAYYHDIESLRYYILQASGRGLLGADGSEEKLLEKAKNHWQQAVKYYNKTLELDPFSFEAAMNLALGSIRRGNTSEGIFYLRKAGEINKGDFRTHFLLGQIYKEQKLHELAAKEFTLALKAADDEVKAVRLPEAYLQLIDCYEWQKGQNEKAVAALKKLIEILKSPRIEYKDVARIKRLIENPAQLYIRLAQLLIRQKRPEEALSYLNAIKADTQQAFVLGHLKAEAFQAMGNVDKAEAELLDLIAKKTDFVSSYLKLAEIYRQKREYAAALVAISKAVQHDLHHGELYEAVENIFKEIKDDDKFLAAYSAYEDREKDNFAYYFLLGQFYDDRFLKFLEENVKPIPYGKKGPIVEADLRYSKGLKAYETALEKRKDFAFTYISYAGLFASNNEFEDAVKVLERAINNNLEIGIIYRQYGTLLARLDRNEEAGAALNKAILLSQGQDLNARYMLAIVLDKMGKKEQAEEELKEVLKRSPDNAPANNTLGYIWAEQGKNLEQAVRLIEKALASEPENGAFIDSLGWAYYMMGKYKKALLKLKEASEREHDPVIFDHLGDVYLKLNKKKEAQEAYLKALDLDPDMEKVREKLERFE